MRQTQSDGELIQACLAGNTGAFEGLVEKYQSLVCAITYSGTGRIDTSEELAQEALLQAWKNLGQLRELDKFPAWLCRIARQTVQSWHRKCRRDTIAQAASLNKARSQVSTIQEPAESIIQQEQEAVIQQALARVPEKYREVLVLYYREQKSTQEVGALMGLSKNSVRQRITRARALLKQQVAAMVETSLERSRPSTAFTAVVMTSVASLPFKQSASAAVVGKVAHQKAHQKGSHLNLKLNAKHHPNFHLICSHQNCRSLLCFISSASRRSCLLTAAPLPIPSVCPMAR